MIHAFAIRNAADGTVSATSYATAGEAVRARTNPADTIVPVDLPGPFEALAERATDPVVRDLCLEIAKRWPS